MNTAFHHHWIWPRASSIGIDESLCFKTSGVDQGDVHWSSQESFSRTDEIYQAMRWIFDNREMLPLLIVRDCIVPDLALEPFLKPLSDGLHLLGDSNSIGGMAEALNLSATAYIGNDIPSTLMLLKRLPGANCFLFLRSSCEAEVSVGSENTDDHMTAEQALRFFKSVVGPNPESVRREK